jgi:hypothetical protein
VAAACVECGSTEATVLRMNYETKQLEPLCPKCDRFYANAAAKADAAAPAPAEPDADPATVIISAGSEWWERPAPDDVEELALLDGVR